MTVIPIEYALCQYQSSSVSFAIKAHRQENEGNPQLKIEQNASGTTFNLLNLLEGGAHIISGAPRQNHIDFYILQLNRETFVNSLPRPLGTNDRSLMLPTLDASGTERPGGKRVQQPIPIFRLPLIGATINGGSRDRFSATASDCALHFDYEIGPARIYGHEEPELHFGVSADIWIEGENLDGDDWCSIEMTNDCYATLVSELTYL